MREFDRQLIRLKEALGVTEDQDVANALGLSKAALSDRKKRGAFPDDKLLALIAKRPDLRLDFDYITIGRHSSEFEAIAEKHQPEHFRAAGKSGLLSVQEEELIGYYRRASEAGRDAILTASKALSDQFKR
ncbi:MAG: helix-turn-helix domain-containing protein [Dechloromonas agitata]|jgi:transcriptional regulator with XRE-family HTH domain|uniref:Helix-turn-helix domain-containing protein n=1 Tax=Dechloromonas agitata TaxID=73030 RepID=A0A930G170_9RHOO|nr:helix-turn-helix domain-containing protein [Dechloromonas agitata]